MPMVKTAVFTPVSGSTLQPSLEASDFGAYCMTTPVVVMFRNRLFGDFPDWYESVDVGDWPLHVLNTLAGGPYGYIDEVWSAHRNHGAGVWTRRSQVEQAKSAVRTQDLFERVLPPEWVAAMHPKMFGANRHRGRAHLRAKEYHAALAFLDWCERHKSAGEWDKELKRDLRRARWRARFARG
ncbi:MAG: hypothetical protein R3F17_12555 [Planctomycetota bacterium]